MERPVQIDDVRCELRGLDGAVRSYALAIDRRREALYTRGSREPDINRISMPSIRFVVSQYLSLARSSSR